MTGLTTDSSAVAGEALDGSHLSDAGLKLGGASLLRTAREHSTALSGRHSFRERGRAGRSATVAVDVTFWNAQTVTSRTVPTLLAWARADRAMGISEWRAAWPVAQKVRGFCQVVVSDNSDLAWLLPEEWRVRERWDSSGFFGVRVEVVSGALVDLVVVHLACDGGARRDQEAGLVAWLLGEAGGQWLVGGDFNCEEEGRELKRALVGGGASVFCDRVATHFATQAQEVREGYRERNLDRVWTGLEVSEQVVVSSRGLSDHVAVRVEGVKVWAVDLWVAASVRRKVVRVGALGRSEVADLEDWVERSTRVRAERDTGWKAFVLRADRERAKGQEGDAGLEEWVRKAAVYRGEEFFSVGESLRVWVMEVRQGEWQERFSGAPSRVKCHRLGKEVFGARPSTWAVESNGERVSCLARVAALSLHWAESTFTSRPIRSLAVLVEWATDLRMARLGGLVVKPMVPVSLVEVEMAMGVVGKRELAGAEGWEGRGIARLTGEIKRRMVLAVAEWVERVCESGEIGVGLGETLLTLIPKRKPVVGWGDLRPIEVDSWAVRVLSWVIGQRVAGLLPAAAGLQFGFVSGRCSLPPVLIVDKMIKQGEMVVFLDLTEAYTSVEPSALLGVMGALGLPACVCRAVSALSSPRRVRVVLAGRVSRRWCWARRGLRQGNSASPGLFSLFLSVALHRLEVALGARATVFAFADDLAMRVADPASLGEVMVVVEGVLRELGLHLNPGKCRIVWLPRSPVGKEPVSSPLGGGPNPRVVNSNGDKASRCDYRDQVLGRFASWWVPSFRYLGVVVPITGNEEAIEKTVQSMWLACRVAKSRRWPVHLLAEVFSSFVWSRFVYRGIFFRLPEKALCEVDKMVRFLFGIRAGRSGAYLGREIPALCEPPERGGLGLIEYRGHAEALVGVLARHVEGSLFWPPAFGNLLLVIFEERVATSHPAVRSFLARGISDISVKKLRGAFPSVRIVRGAEKEWAAGWGELRLLDPERAQVAWRLAFDIYPCAEHWVRHSEVAELKPCRWCATPVVMGPSHMRVCTVFWSAVTWEGASAFRAAAHPSHFLANSERDRLCELVDLFLRFVSAPTTEWDDYVLLGRVKKRRRVATRISAVERRAMLDGFARIEVVVGEAGDVRVSEERVRGFQWRGVPLELWTDGSAGTGVASWAVVDVHHGLVMSGRVVGPQTNVRAELLGVVAALTLIAKRGDAGARIVCDCQVVVDVARGLARRLANLDLWTHFDMALDKAGIPPSSITWTQAHVGTLGNELADMAARAETQRILDSRASLYKDTNHDEDQVSPAKRRRYDPSLDGWEDE